jgi:hypothetical protein
MNKHEFTLQSVYEELQTVKSLIKGLSEAQKNEILKTQHQVLQEFNISLPTLLSWRQKGIIKCHRIGSRIFYKQSDIEAALIAKN